MRESPAALTADYDRWLASQIEVVTADVARKHDEMRGHAYRFLRGTYYLWLDRVATEAPEVLTASRVALVGDLHVENFGTWRDDDQIRRWGVNDFDELGDGPWLLDLLRLAVSAAIAPHLDISTKEMCRVVLESYAAATPGGSIALTDASAADLRELVPEFADPARFYADLGKGAVTTVPDDIAAAAAGVAERGWSPTWHHHEAGTGSLGHRRAVGVGPAADGTPHAREAKQLGPGSAVWAATRHPHLNLPTPDANLYERVIRAIRGPAAAARVRDWHIRDLAPDVVRIQPTGQPQAATVELLRAMAQAVANVHGTDAEAGTTARAAAAAFDTHHFHELVTSLAAITHADHEAFKRAQ